MLASLLDGQRRLVLRRALVSCGTLTAGIALACAGVAAPAGAATHPRPVLPHTATIHPVYLGHRALSVKTGIRPDISDTYYPITNGYDNICLDAETDSGGTPNDSGDKVQLWTCNSGATQQYWDFAATIGGYGPITNEYGDHLCLDAETDGGANPSESGDKVQMWSCTGASNQQWEMYTTSNDEYAFVNEYSGSTYLAAENDASGNPDQCGDNIQVQAWLYSDQATWDFGDNFTGCS
jgi:hypothetical protein